MQLWGSFLTFGFKNYTCIEGWCFIGVVNTVFFNFNVYFHIEGTASGVTRGGRTYKATITEKVVFKVSCANDRIFIPTQGKKDIEVDGSLKITVDYGDGTCDNTVTLTKGEDSREIDVTDVRQG